MAVLRADGETVVVALGVAPGDDVLPLLSEHDPAIPSTGETVRLRSIGVPPRL